MQKKARADKLPRRKADNPTALRDNLEKEVRRLMRRHKIPLTGRITDAHRDIHGCWLCARTVEKWLEDKNNIELEHIITRLKARSLPT